MGLTDYFLPSFKILPVGSVVRLHVSLRFFKNKRFKAKFAFGDLANIFKKNLKYKPKLEKSSISKLIIRAIMRIVLNQIIIIYEKQKKDLKFYRFHYCLFCSLLVGPEKANSQKR